MEPRVDVVIPAAGRISGAFAQAAGTDVKALIRIGRQTVIEHTLHVLRESDRIGRIAVVAPDDPHMAAACALADVVLPEGSGGIDNVYRGLDDLQRAGGSEATNPNRRVLILTGDLPFVTPQCIASLLNAASHTADISIPAVRGAAFDARFPGAPREYVRLADGEWTMGCGFVANHAALMRVRPHVERVFEARKSQFRMAMLLGLPFILRFALHRAALADIVSRCSDILGVRGEAIAGGSPELAFDIDHEAEWRYAVRAAAGRAG